MNNGKLPQPIIESKGIYQPNNIIDNPTIVLLTVNTPRDIIAEDSKLLQHASGHNNQFLYYTNSKNTESGDKDKNLINNNN